MENPIAQHHHDAPEFFRKWGFWAVIAGAAALMLVFVQIAGPGFEPKPSVATQVGEIAGEIKRSAWRTFLGMPKEPAQPEVSASLSTYAVFAGPALGLVAIVLSLFSGIARENRKYAAYGVSLGCTAVLFHFFWWLALLFAGVALMIAIINNIGDIFSLS
ncbi:MAG: hypothetical protein RIA09_04315 [Hoeflea sp.]|uniref:hypothetical protein n=1 Tax=Hoeflea sp. TaxID=1940281 RepID=UPI0032EFB771